MSAPAPLATLIEQSDGDMDALLAALYEREDRIADFIRQAGAMFGLYPQIVAEVMAQCGLGTPLSEDERLIVSQGYVRLITELFNNGNQ